MLMGKKDLKTQICRTEISIFTTPELKLKSTTFYQENQTHTFTPFYLSGQLYSLFRLSSLVHHGLYSLESSYTAVKSQEHDYFHVLAFIAGFLPH